MLLIDRLLTENEQGGLLRRETAAGLSVRPPRLPSRLLFDHRGIRLRQDMARLPQFYTARCESEILATRAAAIAGATGAVTLLELGPRTPEVSRMLVAGLAATLQVYTPVEQSREALVASAASIARHNPRLAIRALVADFASEVHLLPARGGRLITLLGGTFGGMTAGERRDVLRRLRDTMEWDDALLIGVDMVRDPQRLVAARIDEFGVNAAFTRNILHVVDREFGANFVPELFDPTVAWNPEPAQLELGLRIGCRQRVSIDALGMTVELPAGTEIRTETVATFGPGQLESEFTAVDLEIDRMWMASGGDYALVLVRPPG
ncbi:L-histidine N(alpha)-methyltransferase [Nocardia rhamnosiphila]|uniref:L-histidine N(alpha)-methyltransferase n=1 Tax=Nocardia rhamnosiphila TaxID=426716 RepID=UPI0004C384AC|nr:L-histidine N(alpha)-methyltransferase [Nocardia rhamnosiphila]